MVTQRGRIHNGMRVFLKLRGRTSSALTAVVVAPTGVSSELFSAREAVDDVESDLELDVVMHAFDEVEGYGVWLLSVWDDGRNVNHTAVDVLEWGFRYSCLDGAVRSVSKF